MASVCYHYVYYITIIYWALVVDVKRAEVGGNVMSRSLEEWQEIIQPMLEGISRYVVGAGVL